MFCLTQFLRHLRFLQLLSSAAAVVAPLRLAIVGNSIVGHSTYRAPGFAEWPQYSPSCRFEGCLTVLEQVRPLTRSIF